MNREAAVQKLRSMLPQVNHGSPDPFFRLAARIRDAKSSVIGKYAPLFTPPNVDALVAEDFPSFLIFRNNQHWDNLIGRADG